MPEEKLRMELREKIAEIIEGTCYETSGSAPELMGAGKAADAILSIPEIAEALRLNTPLSEAIKMMEGVTIIGDVVYTDGKPDT